MNNNIQKLYDKSFVRDDYVNVGPDGPSMGFKFDPDKFAELIVQECASIIEHSRIQGDESVCLVGATVCKIKQQFGVQY